MDYGPILEEIRERVRPCLGQGRVATYIPALARVPADKFGIAVRTVAGDEFAAGDADEPFSVQSVSKVFTLMLALERVGEALWERVGREPSGNPFNSLSQLEYERGIPRNPLINAGALVVLDVLHEAAPEPKRAILEYVRALAGNPRIGYDEEVAASEDEFGFRNRALANFIKSHGNLRAPVEPLLDAYFHHCALAMSCRDLARAFLPLANRGVAPGLGRAVLSPEQTRHVNALLATCGLYDAVGNFAYRVGLPAKSGVGGGIVAVMPGRLAVAVWSPGLEKSGNSLAGIAALELFASRAGLSIF